MYNKFYPVAMNMKAPPQPNKQPPTPQLQQPPQVAIKILINLIYSFLLIIF